jgi:hypothetical protein
VALETVVVTWMDGPVATYENITFSTRGGELIIYNHDSGGPVVEWRFPESNIRAIGKKPWTADVPLSLPADHDREGSGPYAP